MKDEFDKRNVKVIGLSVDGVEDHKKWLDDIIKSGFSPLTQFLKCTLFILLTTLKLDRPFTYQFISLLTDLLMEYFYIKRFIGIYFFI